MLDLLLTDAGNGTVFPATLHLGFRGTDLMVNTYYNDENEWDGIVMFLSPAQLIELHTYLTQFITKEIKDNG